MCLHVLTSMSETAKAEIKAGWKVMLRRYGSTGGTIAFPFCSGIAEYAPRKWLHATDETLKTVFSVDSYPAGFHCFFTQDAARAYALREFNTTYGTTYGFIVLCPVECRRVHTVGWQGPLKCFVCASIMFTGEEIDL